MELTAVALALFVAALVLPISVAASNMALFLLTLAILRRLNADGRRQVRAAWRAEPALTAVVAYVAAGLLAAALGVDLGHSLHDCVKDLHRLWSLGLFVAALALEPDAAPWPAFGAGFGLAALIGLGQSALSLLHGQALERAHAFVHPATYGEQLALAALGGMSWLARPGAAGRGARRLAAATTLLCAAALALSQTRAALIALAVGAVAIAVREPHARRWAAAGLGLGAVGAALGQFLRYGAPGAANVPAYQQGMRYTLWRTAWRMFRDHPWSGVGPGHYRTQFGRYFTGTLDGQADWGSAHNLYLHQLAERGLVGAAALAVLLAVLLVRALRAERARRDAAALWAAAAVPAFLVMNMTETAFQTEQFATLFLLIWAFGTARRARAENL